ncbi:DUF1929 domain-containing protein [Cladorrhinum sp. PSN332]|nr:DUF1929 domain-containing protein [Cladorrhinum sp. PSN332]
MPWQRDPTALHSGILAIHVALLPTGPQGEVLLLGGDEHWRDQTEEFNGNFRKTRIYEVQSHKLATQDIKSPDSDVFCSGHAYTKDGRLLIVGGTRAFNAGGIHDHALAFWGHRRCWLWSPRQREWQEAAQLQPSPQSTPSNNRGGGRWYPGALTLGDGEVMAFFGHVDQTDVRHRNVTPERYNVQANAWRYLSGNPQMANSNSNFKPQSSGGQVRHLMYPRTFLMPDGMVFIATPMPYDWKSYTEITPQDPSDGPHRSVFFNPETGTYVTPEISDEPVDYKGWSFPGVLLPLLPTENYRPRVLLCGAARALRIDLGAETPNWQSVENVALGRTRYHSCAVLLPTGQVCLVGGVNNPSNDQGERLPAELYDPSVDWAQGQYNPGLGSWSTEDSDPADPEHGIHMPLFSRNYHSAAILLPNGKVLTCGGNINERSGNPDDDGDVKGVGIKFIELYNPPYPSGSRPVILDCPASASYGHSFTIHVSDASSLQRVAFIRNGSCTHAYDFDQRYVGLAFTTTSGDNEHVRVTAPPNGNVAPPGYYMLWTIDTAGRPCELAKFVRLAHRSCQVITDHSTFSSEQVAAASVNGPANFPNAVYVKYDGFIDHELTDVPVLEVRWDSGDQALVPTSQLTLTVAPRLLEVSPGKPDIPQQITFPFHIQFPDTSIFDAFPDARQIRLTFRLGEHVCSQTIDLVHSPNPYLLDINPATNNHAWLSTDVRVFAVESGQSKFGDVSQGNSDPILFIRQCLDKLNSPNNNGNLLFEALSTDAPLDLASRAPSGRPIFNYAISRVRYRALTTQARSVRCFFRTFGVAATGLDFRRATTYRRFEATGRQPVPLLGITGGDVSSIPFFASPRVQTVEGQAGPVSMEQQLLDSTYEVRDITPNSNGNEVTVFFGAWLDINQPNDKRFPLSPGTSNGPYPAVSALSILEHMRGRHQCIVAEVVFDQDPTAEGETPGSSDNLAQRNLTLLHSDNPGTEASHTAVHTLEIKPTILQLSSREPALQVMQPLSSLQAVAESPAFGMDELLLKFNNLPPSTLVTLSFAPPITTQLIFLLASLRLSPIVFESADDTTLSFRVGSFGGGVAYLPVPPFPGNKGIPCLVSITLPSSAAIAGRVYTLTVQQATVGQIRRGGDEPKLAAEAIANSTTLRGLKIIGSNEFSLRVSKRAAILGEEKRTLSVMKWIAAGIPRDDRWWEIMQRYVGGLEEKVDALGGKAEEVHGNPDGSGRPVKGRGGDEEGEHGRCEEEEGCGCCCDGEGDEEQEEEDDDDDDDECEEDGKVDVWHGKICAVHFDACHACFIGFTGVGCGCKKKSKGKKRRFLNLNLHAKTEKLIVDAWKEGRKVKIGQVWVKKWWRHHAAKEMREVTICRCGK